MTLSDCLLDLQALSGEKPLVISYPYTKGHFHLRRPIPLTRDFLVQETPTGAFITLSDAFWQTYTEALLRLMPPPVEPSLSPLHTLVYQILKKPSRPLPLCGTHRLLLRLILDLPSPLALTHIEKALPALYALECGGLSDITRAVALAVASLPALHK